MLIDNVNNNIATEKQKMIKDQNLGPEDFLNMLVMQLRYQDPMAPDDTGQFAQQIATFNIMEQNVKMNESLTEMLEIQKTAKEKPIMQDMVSYINRVVEVDSSIVTLVDNEAVCLFSLSEEIDKVKLTIANSYNEDVFSTYLQDNLQKTNVFVWDGRNQQGDDLEMGQYKIKLSYLDKEGKEINLPVHFSGKVDSISNSNGEVYLEVAGILIDPKQVISVKKDVTETI